MSTSIELNAQHGKCPAIYVTLKESVKNKIGRQTNEFHLMSMKSRFSLIFSFVNYIITNYFNSLQTVARQAM